MPYAIVNGWSYSAGRDVITKHRKRLAQFRYDGLPDTAEPMLGESLALFASTWLAETSRIIELTDKVTHDLSLRCHALGVVGFESGAFIDIPMERSGLVELDDALPRWESSFWTGAGFASAFEWGAIEQLQPTRAVSTIKLIDYAASLGQKIFDVTPGNWVAVQPQLVGYSALDIGKIQGFIDNGYRIILPENGSLVQDSWTGAGYIALGPNDDFIGHLITGGLKGGLSALLYDVKNAVKDFFFDFWDESFGSGSIFDNEQSQDPIDLVTGDLLYQHEDLTIGSAAFPYGLSLQRTYTSGARLLDGSMGLGWRHGFDISVRTDSDGFQGMGEDSPIDAAATIAGLYVAMDMYGAFTPGGTALTSIRNPERMLSAALVVRWTMDQLINNIVTVAEIGKTLQFVRLPDGTYNPPPGSASSLVQQANAGYLYRTAQGVTLDFDPSGLPVDWQHPNGARLSFSHTNGQLQSVANSFGRSATFSYSGGRVSSVTDDTGRSINYAYDNAGNLTTYTDAAGKVTTYAYDLPGRLTQIFTPGQPANAKVTNIYNALDQVVKQVDAAGNPWEYSFASGFKGEEFSPTGAYFTWYFDSRGNKITERNQVFQTTRYRYDGHNRVIRTEFPENNDIEYLYDANHNLVHKETHPKPPFVLPENIVIEQYTYDLTFNKMLTYTDPLGRVTTNTYDPQTGNLLTVTLPAVGGQSPQTTYAYNRQGQVLAETGPTGQVLRYTYDSVSGNLLSIINDAGRLNLTTQFGYDAVGNVITQTDPNGRTATLRYDARRRIASTFAAAPYNHETRFTYDDDDHLTLGQVATGDSTNPWQVTQYFYDTADRLVQEVNPEGAFKEYYYDYWGNVKVAYDEEYLKIARFYDVVGRLDQVWDNLNQVQEEYNYTPNGQVESVADANNNVTRYNYDSLDRLSETAFPDGSFERYTYDVAGNTLSKTTRAGQTITWTYDALNRVKTKTLPGAPPVTYTYDLAGRQTRVTGTSGAINYGYDTAGRLTTVINADNKVLRYQYDAAGNRTRLTYSNNDVVTYTYDELNRLSAITGTDGAALARYRYDALSRRVSLTYGNGTQAEYRYEPDNDLSVLTNQFTANAVTFSYTHNKVHQRTRVDISNDAFAAWPSLNPSTTYTANALNQYTQVGGVQHSYDGNGNLSDDTVNTYVYDAENRLTQTTTPTATLDFAYDPLGRRIQKTVGGSTTKYLYDQNQVVEEFDSAGQRLRHYVYGPGLDQPVAMSVGSSRYYYYFDGLGSVVALSDATGTDVERYAYGPFGEDTVTRSALGNPYRYTARRFDEETGLYYYRARFYSTDLKRFLQPDPIGYSDGMNLYAYVGNDPLNFTDPTGQFKGDLRGEYYDLVSDELSEDDLRAEMEQMMGNFFPGGAVTPRIAFAFRSFARQLFDKAKARVSRFINPVTKGVTNFATRNEARRALNGNLGTAANRFFRGATSKSRDFKITEVPGGGKRFEFFSPARNKGFGKSFVQEVDSQGGVIREFKDTLGPKGLIERKFIRGGP